MNQFSMQPQDMNAGMQGMNGMPPVGNMPVGDVPAGNMPVAPVEKPAKKLNIAWIVAGAELLIIIILAVVMLFSGGKAKNGSIADDKTETVSMSPSGDVEAFAAFCTTPEYYITFDTHNRYFIERIIVDFEDIEAETEEEEEEALAAPTDLIYEKGSYTVDGNNVHLKPQGDEEYWVSYKSHKLTYKEVTYNCTNEE